MLRGCGRWLRCPVGDRTNGQLIGIRALSDPVSSLRVCDEWIDWNQTLRRERLAMGQQDNDASTD